MAENTNTSQMDLAISSIVSGNAFLHAESAGKAKRIFDTLNKYLSEHFFGMTLVTENFHILEENDENVYTCNFTGIGEWMFQNTIGKMMENCKNDPFLTSEAWVLELNYVDMAECGAVMFIDRIAISHEKGDALVTSMISEISHTEIELSPEDHVNDIGEVVFQTLGEHKIYEMLFGKDAETDCDDCCGECGLCKGCCGDLEDLDDDYDEDDFEDDEFDEYDEDFDDEEDDEDEYDPETLHEIIHMLKN